MTGRFRYAPSASWSWGGVRVGVGGTICQEEEIPSNHKQGFSSVALQRADALPVCLLSGHARFLGMRAQTQEVFSMCNY